MVTVDQSAITSGALRAWRSPSKPVSETELDAALKAALEGLPPSNRQVHPARPSNRGRQTMAHVPHSFDAEALRDPDAEVGVLHDLPDETQAPPRAPRYYSNQAANKRGRLTEQPQPRQVRAAAVAGQESECCERRNADNRPNGDEVLPPLTSTSASLEAVAPGDCVQPGIATVTPPLDGGVADGSPASPDTCRNLGLGSSTVEEDSGQPVTSIDQARPSHPRILPDGENISDFRSVVQTGVPLQHPDRDRAVRSRRLGGLLGAQHLQDGSMDEQSRLWLVRVGLYFDANGRMCTRVLKAPASTPRVRHMVDGRLLGNMWKVGWERIQLA